MVFPTSFQRFNINGNANIFCSATSKIRGHPETDGLVKRLNHTLKQMSKLVSTGGCDWDTPLGPVIFTYTILHLVSPHFTLFYGREVYAEGGTKLDRYKGPFHILSQLQLLQWLYQPIIVMVRHLMFHGKGLSKVSRLIEERIPWLGEWGVINRFKDLGRHRTVLVQLRLFQQMSKGHKSQWTEVRMIANGTEHFDTDGNTSYVAILQDLIPNLADEMLNNKYQPKKRLANSC